MKLQEIKDSVLAGKKVYWANKAYEVRFKFDQWYIYCTLNGNTIGLTWRDGITLNGKEEEFFVG